MSLKEIDFSVSLFVNSPYSVVFLSSFIEIACFAEIAMVLKLPSKQLVLWYTCHKRRIVLHYVWYALKKENCNHLSVAGTESRCQSQV